MHDFTYYAHCVATVELEVERLRDLATKKSCKNAMITQIMAKAKNGKGKEVPKSNGSRNMGVSKKKKAHYG